VRRSLSLSLIIILGIAVAAIAGTFIAGNHPSLGLDLQGGASVVLKPTTKVPSSTLDESIAIIRQRVDALGVAEPDISRQGNAIVVQLPGVKNADDALSIVGQTAQLYFRPVIQNLPPYSAPTTTTTAKPAEGSTTTTAAGAAPTTTTTTGLTAATVKTTPTKEDKPEAVVILPEYDADGKTVVRRYELGPAELTGKVLKSANASLSQAGQWEVDFTTTGSGSKQMSDVTTKYVNKQLAIDLDGRVISAPTINQPISSQGQITGSFTQKEAKRLATVLRYGALPVKLEPQTVQKVSATLGKDSLNAGIIAGIVGLALVLLYMILYYRALGLVVLLGLAVSGALLWSIVSFLGKTQGLALSLSGATGIIVSVGVTVDSYIVYFERLKDELRSGKTIRSSVDRGFSRAYRTILAADISSLIGAFLLYYLTVGAVRGFAFFLGLSTALDLITAYFFTRPMVVLLGRNRLFTEARWFGVARGLAAEPAGSPS
jgi:preprotein translocase subunit SecD